MDREFDETLAEKSAFDYGAAVTEPHHDFVTLVPVWNFGPYLHQPRKPRFGSSPSVLLDTFPTGGDTGGNLAGDFVDVRDSALLHVLSLQNKEIGGERLANANYTSTWQGTYDILNDAGSDAPGKDTIDTKGT